MSTENKNAKTRERLLKSAEQLFAQRGYDAVSVREITKTAKSNLASVNYHFGNKKTLYLNVFRELWMPRARCIRECFVQNLARFDDTSPASVIQSLAESIIKGPLSDAERLCHFQLMIREITKPSEAFEMVTKETMKPTIEGLEKLLQPYMNEGIDKERTLLNLLSVFSIVLYFNFARLPVSKIIGHDYDLQFQDRLVQHIVDFSLFGLPVMESTK